MSAADTRCEDCGHTFGGDDDPACPECGGRGRPLRSEHADFGGGEGGMDQL